MTDTIFILVAVTGVESEAVAVADAAVAAIETLDNGEVSMEVLETVIDDGGSPDDPVIYFP